MRRLKMTQYELHRYTMSTQEEKEWFNFCNAIKKKFESLELPQMAYEIIDKKLLAKVPYQYSRGYSQTTGYYYISEGDRGEIHTVFITISREDAEDEMLKVLAHDIGYQYILKNTNKIEIEHRKNWRYYSVIDRIENNRAISHDIENSNWKYNTKYDYRKYWFEFTLYILRETTSLKAFQEEISRYEKLMNYHFNNPFWKYDLDKSKFICI